jgi:predicted thioredoxin/glutaredoxin
MDMKVEIFVHRNCTDCAILLDFLKTEGLMNRVVVIDTEKYPFEAIERGVLSTPSIFVDGKLKYAGKVDLQEFKDLLHGKMAKKNTENLIEKLMVGVVNSFAVTAWLYLHRDLASLLEQREFVSTVTGIDENDLSSYEKLREDAIKEGENILRNWEERMMRNIVSNFVRELFWLYERKLSMEEMKARYPLEVFAHWLMVRGGAVGRVGLSIIPLSDKVMLDRIKRVYEFLELQYDELWSKIMKEQWELMGTVKI